MIKITNLYEHINLRRVMSDNIFDDFTVLGVKISYQNS